MSRVAVAILLLVPSVVLSQPYAELGLAEGTDRARSPFIATRAEAGFRVSPTVAVGISADVGVELNFEGESAYSLVIPVVQLTPSRASAVRFRLGAGWAAAQVGHFEEGEGLAGRAGVAIDLPRSTLFSAMLTADFVSGLTGSYHRISTYPAGPATGRFDFGIMQLGLALHVGG